MSNALQILIIAVALAMDAVSVSVAIGMRAPHSNQVEGLKLAISFALFQMFMPIIGWAVGNSIRSAVSTYSGWIAFVLLVLIGLKMIYEAFHQDDESVPSHPSFKKIIALSIATSIDALVVGTTIGITKIPILISVVIIGVVTFLLCAVAYFFAKHLGKLFGEYVEIVGGIVLVGIGFTFLFR